MAAEPGGREKGRRKGFEVKLNPMRVGRAEGRGNWAHFSGWKSQSGEEMGSGRMEATCVRTPLQSPAVCDLGAVA